MRFSDKKLRRPRLLDEQSFIPPIVTGGRHPLVSAAAGGSALYGKSEKLRLLEDERDWAKQTLEDKSKEYIRDIKQLGKESLESYEHGHRRGWIKGRNLGEKYGYKSGMM